MHGTEQTLDVKSANFRSQLTFNENSDIKNCKSIVHYAVRLQGEHGNIILRWMNINTELCHLNET